VTDDSPLVSQTHPPLLRVTDLNVGFRTGAGEINAVNGINFELYRGETLAILLAVSSLKGKIYLI